MGGLLKAAKRPCNAGLFLGDLWKKVSIPYSFNVRAPNKRNKAGTAMAKSPMAFVTAKPQADPIQKTPLMKM